MKLILDKIQASVEEIQNKLTAKPQKQKALACSMQMGANGSEAEVEMKEEEEDDSVSKEEMTALAEYVQYRLDSIRRDIDGLYNRFWEHESGHLPKIVGAANMEKALEALGLAGDYKVEKRTIYANDGTVNSVEWTVKK